MQDRPTAAELLQAIRECLEAEIIPALGDPRVRYQALIVAHALGILERELPGEDARLRAELAALDELLGRSRPVSPPETLDALRAEVLVANRELALRIRQGQADGGPFRERVLAHLEAVVEEKLGVNNPARLAALRKARSA
jgi:hypothetical protein